MEPTDLEWHSVVAEEFESWIKWRITTPPGVVVGDLMLIIWNLMLRLRTALTFDELWGEIRSGLKLVEHRLQSGQAYLDDEGNVANMWLAEEIRELGEIPDEIPDFIPESWTEEE